MRQIEAEAIVLDVRDLQERDRIVAWVSAEHGQKRGVARSARTKYSRFAGQLQPLAKVAIQWFEKEGRDLVRIQEVSLVRPAAAMQEDLEGILLGAYLAEHMLHFVQENEDARRLYRLLDTTLEALLGGVDRSLAVRYFEVWMLRLSGVFPSPHQCPLCSRSLLERAVLAESEGMLVCGDCQGHGFQVSEAVITFLRRTGRENLDAMCQNPVGHDVLEQVEDLCTRIRRFFLQDELKSYLVMRKTLAIPV